MYVYIYKYIDMHIEIAVYSFLETGHANLFWGEGLMLGKHMAAQRHVVSPLRHLSVPRLLGSCFTLPRHLVRFGRAPEEQTSGSVGAGMLSQKEVPG